MTTTYRQTRTWWTRFPPKSREVDGVLMIPGMAFSVSHRKQDYGQPFGGLPTLAEEEASSRGSVHLRAAKPRRPRNHRRSITWDPTLDNYDDTFAFRQSGQQDVRGTTSLPQHTTLDNIQIPDRRSTLLAHPAQRVPLPTTHHATDVVDANSKKRRTSLSQSIPPQQPACTSNTVQLERIPEKPSMTIRRDPRRRTIYIPADDTTIATIHPGAPNSQAAPKPLRPRHSDAFLDLATQNVNAASPRKEAHNPYRSGEATRKASTKSLAVAPRRAPLQESTRVMQVANITHDTPGTGGGKENVPPGFGLKAEKQAYDHTLNISLDAQKGASVATKRVAQPPVHRLPLVDGCANQNGDDYLGPRSTQPQVSPSSGNSRASPVNSNASLRRTSMLPSSRRSSSMFEARNNMPKCRQRASILAEGQPSRTTLSATQWSSRLTAASFPVLVEDIAQPELYEDRWLSHQEAALTECVNSLLINTRSKGGIDVHTHGTLKRELSALYSDPAVDLMHRRLQASLRFGALAVSKETLAQVARYKDDMQHKRRFLDLWLKSYDLEALQAAAEVVVGREIPLAARLSGSPTSSALPSSPSRRRTLETFLKHFLVGNEDALVIKTSVRPSTSAAGPSAVEDDYGSQAWAWRRTVVRSLMIIWLLDRLQQSQLPQRPHCLFRSSSTFKSSVAVVSAVGNLLLPSAGNIARTLEHLSYHVSHVQYPLEEHQYHVNNLAIDMRDGVSLTRLVETLLYRPSSVEVQQQTLTVTLPDGDTLTSKFGSEHGKQCWPLSQHLKYPCLSRVQKVYNVQVALSALREVESPKILLRNVKAEDIVDGHREKTVSLLWAIVSRWGLEALVDFRLVENEISRLRKAWAQRQEATGGYGSRDTSPREDVDAELPYLEGLDRHTRLLRLWAQSAARLHGVCITNFSTSFADGKAYVAIVLEYAACLRHAPAEFGLRPSSPLRMPSSCAAAAKSNTDLQGSSRPIIQALKALGCSRTFVELFASSSGRPIITGSETTVALLAFLASRLLPASRPHFAAMFIQRVWRRMKLRCQIRKRTRLALLARECSHVVRQQQRIVNAATTIQRAWRQREEALTKTRDRGNPP